MFVFADDYGPWIVAVLALPVIFLIHKRFPEPSGWTVWVYGVVAVVLLQIDSVLLGPLARNEYGDGGDKFYGYFPYLGAHQAGIWMHELAGGVDKLALGRYGGEYFSGRRWLSGEFPFWFVVVLLRVGVPFLAFSGIYLAGVRLFKIGAFPALAFATLYAYGMDTTSTLTFLYAFGIAGLPLLLYLFFRPGPWTWKHWGGALLYSAAYIAMADPFYWLPMVWFSAAVLALTLWPVSWGRIITCLVLLTVAWVANYADVIKGFMDYVPYSSRAAYRPEEPTWATFIDALVYQVQWMLNPNIKRNIGGITYVLPLLVAAFMLIRSYSRPLAIALTGALLAGFLHPFMTHVPWDKVGLKALSSYSWYFEYGAYTLVMFAAMLGLRGEGRPVGRAAVVSGVVALAVSAGYWFELRVQIMGQTATRGNLSSMTDIENLKDASWLDDPSAQVLVVPGRLSANAPANYGFNSATVEGTMMLKGVYEFWRFGVNRGFAQDFAAAGLPRLSAFNKCSNGLSAEEYMDVDWLRVANIRYIATYIPLESDALNLVSGPQSPSCPGIVDMVVKTSPPVQVYKVEGALPSAYTTQCVKPDTSATAEAFFSSTEITKTILGGCAFVEQSDAQASLNESFNEAKAIQDVELTKVHDGYDLAVPHKDSTQAVIVNASHTPWWDARNEKGEKLEVLEANRFQMLVIAPPGTEKVELRYTRKTFFGEPF